jgi:hypothetical protein
MSFWAYAMGEPKSIIDRDNGTIILRSSMYPKGGCEWVIAGDTIVQNEFKRRGVVSETIQISEISELALDLGKISGGLRIWGNRPKLWVRPLPFNAPDMFVAYEAYAYILAQRINDTQNSIKHSISPVLVGVKQQLDNGELDKEALKAKGVHF